MQTHKHTWAHSSPLHINSEFQHLTIKFYIILVLTSVACWWWWPRQGVCTYEHMYTGEPGWTPPPWAEKRVTGIICAIRLTSIFNLQMHPQFDRKILFGRVIDGVWLRVAAQTSEWMDVNDKKQLSSIASLFYSNHVVIPAVASECACAFHRSSAVLFCVN